MLRSGAVPDVWSSARRGAEEFAAGKHIRRWRLPVDKYLRPTKWRNAARRRIFAATVPRRVELHPRADMEFVGTAYGGWPVPLQLLNRSSVVYSVGAGAATSAFRSDSSRANASSKASCSFHFG